MENYGMKMEILIKVNGRIFKLKDGEFIIQKKGHIFGENGKKTNKMDLE